MKLPSRFHLLCLPLLLSPLACDDDDASPASDETTGDVAGGQTDCNDNGAMSSGSANFTWRWAFLG